MRAELRQIGERRQAITAEREHLTARTREAVELARDEGVPMVEISRLLGISTQAIWKLMRTGDS